MTEIAVLTGTGNLLLGDLGDHAWLLSSLSPLTISQRLERACELAS
jgi:hypothetical protein